MDTEAQEELKSIILAFSESKYGITDDVETQMINLVDDAVSIGYPHSEKLQNWLIDEGLKGNHLAQYCIANWYDNEEKYDQAAYWYIKSAKQGNRYAQHNLGHKYFFGEGVKQNFNKSTIWYTRAAEQGHAPSQYEMSTIWYTRAAEQGRTHHHNTK